MQRALPSRLIALGIFLLVGCSESGTRSPTAPTPPPPPPPLTASLSPAADTVEAGQTAEFTLEITGGDANAEPAWTCASADATVASAAQTASGCSATGTGTGSTTIVATVTRGALTATASASLRVTSPPLTAVLSPAADTVQTGQTAEFTLEITGGDLNAEPAWTCASADTTVASAAQTASGCSATGTGTGSTTIVATVTRGALTATASASLRVTSPPLTAVLSPAADTVQTGQTAEFTLEITGGDLNAEPAWTCASADTTVASAAQTASGCSATGTGTGTTTVVATVTRGALTATASASLRVTPPPLTASLSPAADTVEAGQTAEFTLEITGGDANAEPAWTCASADTTVASAARTASGCSATGAGTGTTTIAATVTRGTASASASATLRVAGARDTFAYWDGNGNGDLTCSEAMDKDEGLRLPAYRDNRDGTGLIYEWLERGRSSDSDDDGISCESSQNPNGYVPVRVTPPTGDRMCPSGSPIWMGLPVCEEVERTGYDRDAFGSAYSSLEDEIIEGLPKSGGQVYTPYSCKLFDIRADGTAATDIEHIVALAEAYDSGLRESNFRAFAGDLVNLTIADPTVNRHEKSDRDAAEWRPSRNTGWFAAKVVGVKQKYGLSVNPAERDALASMLASDSSRTVTCN